MNRIFIAIVSFLLITSCNTSKHVQSNRFIQKRKYNHGWHVNFKKGYKSSGIEKKTAIETVEFNASIVENEEVEPRINMIKQPLEQVLKSKVLIARSVSVPLDLEEQRSITYSSESVKDEKKINDTSSMAKNAAYPRFGVNDAETTLWIGGICLVLGIIALAIMGSVPYLALSIILLIAGTVLLLIGFVNLIIGFFRSIL